MRETFSLVPAYLQEDRAEPWFSEYGVQQTRGFRALKVWLTIQHFGLEGYRELDHQRHQHGLRPAPQAVRARRLRGRDGRPTERDVLSLCPRRRARGSAPMRSSGRWWSGRTPARARSSPRP
ncbi:MAG: hypothetical protein HND48_01790 [Chloroflexi bacterium]|nr:hypothetical protein [Chloroflexota bacterium]